MVSDGSTPPPRAQMPLQPSGKDTEEMEAEGDSAAEMNGEEEESEEERSGSQTESEEESSGDAHTCTRTHTHTHTHHTCLLYDTPQPTLTALLSQRWMMRTTNGAAVSASVRCWTWRSSSRS